MQLISNVNPRYNSEKAFPTHENYAGWKYMSCERNSIDYENEAWSVKAENMKRQQRTEKRVAWLEQ